MQTDSGVPVSECVLGLGPAEGAGSASRSRATGPDLGDGLEALPAAHPAWGLQPAAGAEALAASAGDPGLQECPMETPAESLIHTSS